VGPQRSVNCVQLCCHINTLTYLLTEYGKLYLEKQAQFNFETRKKQEMKIYTNTLSVSIDLSLRLDMTDI